MRMGQNNELVPPFSKYNERAMAQAQPERPKEPTNEKATTQNDISSKLNAQAPEFVPKSRSQPISGFFYPCFHFIGGGSEWLYVGDQEPVHLVANSDVSVPSSPKNHHLSDDLRKKIIKQVEYQFSDATLAVSDTLMKYMNKDPEGYVPITAFSSFKKIKSLTNDNYMLAMALRSSMKLVVSEDGKRVKRKHPFSEKDKEDLQSRMVVVENLPDDYSHQNLEKIFGVAGSVKTVRICHPQDSSMSSRSSKAELLISNKLHALVEYESVDQAEKAVAGLNDERNWRRGLRVRLLLRRSPRSVIKGRRTEHDHFDTNSDDDDIFLASETLKDSPQVVEQPVEHPVSVDDNSGGGKKGWGRGRNKKRGQSHNGRGLLSSIPIANSSMQSEASTKQPPRGPRMPDGTRGFTMGRGKPTGGVSSGKPIGAVQDESSLE